MQGEVHETRGALEARVAERVARVRGRIERASSSSGRRAGDVTVVAAVKYLDDRTCAAIVRAGVHDLAENRFAPLEQRHAAGAIGGITPIWHFIGRLQSRQAVSIAQHVAMIHSLCTASAAERLARAAQMSGLALPRILVQVNVAGDPGKDGIAPAELDRFLESLPDEIRIAGLMTMPPLARDGEESRRAFASLRQLRDDLVPRWDGRHPLGALSMGTTQDHLVAVEEGATHVRLGRTLHAERE